MTEEKPRLVDHEEQFAAGERGAVRRGALVVSLDFELTWGVRHAGRRVDADGARRAVDALLSVFVSEGIAATWATVGFLFAADRAEREHFAPRLRPSYHDGALSPYAHPTGPDETRDPSHFALSLLREVQRTPGQEVGSHTHSHFFTRAPGQQRDQFAADLDSARRIATQAGFDVRALVFPKNQVNEAYLDLLPAYGFTSYRGAQRGWRHRGDALPQRAARLWQSHAGRAGEFTAPWSAVCRPAPSAAVNVPGTAFLRPASPSTPLLNGARVRRLRAGLRDAARRGRVLHLWWHPHNFAAHLAENLAALGAVLRTVHELRDAGRLDSLTMTEAAERGAAC